MSGRVSTGHEMFGVRLSECQLDMRCLVSGRVSTEMFGVRPTTGHEMFGVRPSVNWTCDVWCQAECQLDMRCLVSGRVSTVHEMFGVSVRVSSVNWT